MNSYRKQTMRQVQELMRELTARAIYESVDRALSSGAVPDEWKEDDNYLLAKAIIDSICRDRPYKPLDRQHQADFDNLHLFL